MADLLDIPDSGDNTHDYLINIQQSCSSWGDLLDSHWMGERVMYVDGSCLKLSDGVYLSGYAVVCPNGNIIEAYGLIMIPL